MTARAAPALGLAAALAFAGPAAADPIAAAGACYGAAWVAAEGIDCNAACGGVDRRRRA